MVIQKTPTKIDKIVSLRIGQHQENAATQIKMDVSDWITVHPTAGFHILFKRPGEVQAQPVLSSLEEGILTWTVQEWETSLIGVGYAEVRAIEAESALVAKSRVIPCSVEESVIEDGEVPPEYSGWVEQILQVADQVDDLKQEITEEIEETVEEAVEEVESIIGAGMSLTAVNLLETVLTEGVYGSDQSANIVLLINELKKVKPVGITAVLSEGSRVFVGTPYSRLDYVVTATFDDETTAVLPDYRVVTTGNVVSGSNTVTIRSRGLTTSVTFEALDITTYTVAYDLTDVTSSSDVVVVEDGERYETVLSVEDDDHYISSVVVTMGGVDITSTAYLNGTITIAEVTGNVTITAVASEYQYLDALHRNTQSGWTNVDLYTDDGTTQLSSPVNTNTFSTEYPAASDCTLTWEIKNITDSEITMGYVGFGNYDCANGLRTGSAIKVTYFVRATTQSGKLAPGATLTGTITIKAGRQLVFVCPNADYSKYEVKIRGNYVNNTLSDYTSYSIDKNTNGYGSYRTMVYYSDNGTTELHRYGGAPRLVGTGINTGDYDAYVSINADDSIVAGSSDLHKNAPAFGAASNNTETNINYAGGSSMRIGVHLWKYVRFKATSDNMDLILSTNYLNTIDGADAILILKIKGVATA